MVDPQFSLYRVIPTHQWRSLSPNAGMSVRDIAILTSRMREILFEAMQDAVIETGRTSRMRSRRGAIFNQIRSGMRPRGSLVPSTVSMSFMFRPWMAIHETGGTINSDKYMTLPMPDALRADGRLKRRNAAGWRAYGTFVWTSPRTGKKFIVYKHKSGRLVFLYYLTKKVEMKKRLFLRQAILNQEAFVVATWSRAVMSIFNSIDLYGMAFEGVRIE